MSYGQNIDIVFNPIFRQIANQAGINDTQRQLNNLAVAAAQAVQHWADFNKIPFNSQNVNSVKTFAQAMADAGISIRQIGDRINVTARSLDGMSHSMSAVYDAEKGSFDSYAQRHSASRKDIIQQLTEAYNRYLQALREYNAVENKNSQVGQVTSQSLDYRRKKLEELREEMGLNGIAYAEGGNKHNEYIAVLDREKQHEIELANAKQQERQEEQTKQIQEQQAIQTANDYLASLKRLQAAEVEYANLRQQYGKNPTADQQQLLSMQAQRVARLREETNQLRSTTTANRDNGVAVEHNNRILQQANDLAEQQAVKLKKVGTTAQQTTGLFANFGNQLKQTFKMVVQSGLSWKIFSALMNAVKSAAKSVVELDKSLTDLQIASGKSKQSAQELLQTYNQMAKELGSTTQAVAESATGWLRQGYSVADTNELVKDSMILSKVGAIEAADATKYLTSALKGYKLESEDALGVVDMLTALDLKAAVSSGELAEGMSQTANMARTTGVEMNELLGIIATVAETTQASASSVGNAMKTVFSRMSNVKAKQNWLDVK